MEMDWKSLALVLVGFAFGMMATFNIHVEDQAKGMAVGMCEVCQQDRVAMVQNFNTLAKQCRIDNPYAINLTFGDLNATQVR